MKLMNLTPHTVTFIGDSNTVVEPSGQLARVSCKTVTTGSINGIPVTENEYGDVEGLPAPEDGTIYIVSSIVASRCKDRSDVFIPNEPVRDDQGRIIGCISLGRV